MTHKQLIELLDRVLANGKRVGNARNLRWVAMTKEQKIMVIKLLELEFYAADNGFRSVADSLHHLSSGYQLRWQYDVDRYLRTNYNDEGEAGGN